MATTTAPAALTSPTARPCMDAPRPACGCVWVSYGDPQVPSSMGWTRTVRCALAQARARYQR